MSMSDAMQQFLASLELPTGESLPVQDLPSVPDTITPTQRIVMDPQSLQAFGNSVREMKKDSWGPDQMKEWDRFISVSDASSLAFTSPKPHCVVHRQEAWKNALVLS